ncbi:MAG TPA: PilZ domain-containing protein [Bryobacteraceae bacterium]|nr:PilZ domain-containing protein [Bryobacteraceae bacterium]
MKPRHGVERRSEARVPAGGAVVRLRKSNTLSASFTGLLVDLARHGFRARHSCLLLRSGELVDFEFPGQQGLASTVWTRIVDGEAETGFRILNESPL